MKTTTVTIKGQTVTEYRVASVEQAQEIIQAVIPAEYTKKEHLLGAKADDRVEHYNAEKSSYAEIYENDEVDHINLFSNHKIIATIVIDKNEVENEMSVEKAREIVATVTEGNTSINLDAEGKISFIYTAKNGSTRRENKKGVENYYKEKYGWTLKDIAEAKKIVDREYKHAQALKDAYSGRNLAGWAMKSQNPADIEKAAAKYEMTVEEMKAVFAQVEAEKAGTENTVETETTEAEVEVEDYAVTPEALEIATQAEIDNARELKFCLSDIEWAAELATEKRKRVEAGQLLLARVEACLGVKAVLEAYEKAVHTKCDYSNAAEGNIAS